MKKKLLIAILILLSVSVYVSVNDDDGKEAYRSNSGLTVKI